MNCRDMINFEENMENMFLLQEEECLMMKTQTRKYTEWD